MRRWFIAGLRHVQYLGPVAFVAMVLSGSVILFKGGFEDASRRPASIYPRRVAVFDFAIASFNRLSQEFAPNVPPQAFSPDSTNYAWVESDDPIHHVSDQLPDISSSYEKIQMAPEFCDFELAGYRLLGGRVEHLPDGEPVTYTLYRNGNDSILSVGLRQPVSPPSGGYWLGSHALYSYRGYSLCLTTDPTGQFLSIIVARAPVTKLLSEVAAADFVFLQR